MPRAGITRERLVVAAAELADEVGYEHVTVSELARRFGVKVASLYSHVSGAQDLMTAVTLLALTEMAERSIAAVEDRSGRDGVAALGGAYRDYAREHPGRYAAARHRLDPETAAASAGPRHADLSRAVLRAYQLGAEDEVHAVRLLGSTVHGFVSLELEGAFAHSSPTSDVSWERVLDSLDVALSDWPSRRSAP